MVATFERITHFKSNSRPCNVSMNSSKSNSLWSKSKCRLKEPKKPFNSPLFCNKGPIRLSLSLFNPLEPLISNRPTKNCHAINLLNNNPFIRLSLNRFNMTRLLLLNSPFTWKPPQIFCNNKLWANKIFSCRNYCSKPRSNYWKSKRKVLCMANRFKN
jgi:hypothetical protein